MAYAYVQSAQNEILTAATSIATTAFSVGNVAAGNLIVVWAFVLTGQTISTVTDNLSNTYTAIGSPIVATGGITAYTYYAKNITGGTCTVTATFSASTGSSGIAAFEYSGLDRTSPLLGSATVDVATPGTGANAVATGSITPSAQPALLWAVCGPVGAGGTIPTVGTGFTARASVFGGADLPEDKRVTALTAVTGTWTATSGTLEHVGVAVLFKEAQLFAYTPSGGLTFAGTAAELRKRSPTPAGGLVFSGTSAQARVLNEGTRSGGLQFSGTAPKSVGRTVTPSGGLLFGGTATELRKRAYSATGGLVFSGTAPFSTVGVHTFSYTMVGGMTFSGAAVELRKRIYAPIGGITFGGTGSAIGIHPGTATQRFGTRRLFVPIRRHR